VRALIVLAACVVIAALSGFGTHEWRSQDGAKRVDPIELRRVPELQPRGRPAQERGGEAVTPSAGTEMPNPVAPSPVPAGGGSDEDEGADDDGANDGDD
jgi:hypothetical protein